MTVGVRPWSASATSTDSNTRASPAVGRRCATSQNASSAKPTLPMRSPARSWPSSVIEVAVGRADRRRVAHAVVLAAHAVASASYSSGGCPVGRRCVATRCVGVRGRASTACQNRGTLNAVSRSAAHARSASKSGALPSTVTTNALTSSSVRLGGHGDHRALEHRRVRADRLLDLGGREVLAAAADDVLLAGDEGEGLVVVDRDEVAGAQPAVDERGRGLLRHPPVARRHDRVAQQQLARAADPDLGAVVVDHAALVDRAEARVLAQRAEGAVGAGAAAPEGAVRRLRHAVARGELEAEAPLEREVEVAVGGGARVGEAQRGVGVVVALGLAHEDLEHRADRVELGRAVAARRVEESAGREARQQHQPGTGRQRAEHRVRRRVDVEEREPGHHDVVGAQADPRREALAGPGVGALRLHDQLRATGGAGGRDQHRDVVGHDVDGQCVAVVAEPAPVAHEVADRRLLRARRTPEHRGARRAGRDRRRAGAGGSARAGRSARRRSPTGRSAR